MSVVSLPRRDVTIPRPGPSPARPRVRPATRTAPTPTTRREARPRHALRQGRLASISVVKKSVAIVAAAVMLSLFGSMLETNRQVELHQLQSQVLQEQSDVRDPGRFAHEPLGTRAWWSRRPTRCIS